MRMQIRTILYKSQQTKLIKFNSIKIKVAEDFISAVLYSLMEKKIHKKWLHL